MDTTARDRKLAFFRRMIWWLPVLAFAIWAAVLVAVGGATSYAGGSFMGVILQALVVGVVVGIICVAAYFGYKYMLERNPNL